MSLPNLNTISPVGDDTVGRLNNNNNPSESDLIPNFKEVEKLITDDTDESLLLPLDPNTLDSIDNIIDPMLFENAQAFTTQDLMVPETITPLSESLNDQNTKKRMRCDSKESQRGVGNNSESDIIPAWLRAENDLRLSFWNNSRARKISKSRYVIPDTNEEHACYTLTDLKSPFFFRVVCSFLNPQKITLGLRGPKIKKCEFDSSYLDQILSAITSISKGAKSKTVNVGNRGGKLKIDVANGTLSISQTYPADIKKFALKNNLGSYVAPDDCQFTLPSSELDYLLASLLETVSFVRMKMNISEQRRRVFENAVDDLLEYQSKMTASQYAVKLFEIYYRLNLAPGDKYPLSVVFPEYYKMFLHVF